MSVITVSTTVFSQYPECENVVVEDRITKEEARRTAEQEEELKASVKVSWLLWQMIATGSCSSCNLVAESSCSFPQGKAQVGYNHLISNK